VMVQQQWKYNFRKKEGRKAGGADDVPKHRWVRCLLASWLLFLGSSSPGGGTVFLRRSTLQPSTDGRSVNLSLSSAKLRIPSMGVRRRAGGEGMLL